MSFSSAPVLPTIAQPCPLTPRLLAGPDPLPSVAIVRGDRLPWDPLVKSSSDLISVTGCLTSLRSHPAAPSHVEWMCPQSASRSFLRGFVQVPATTTWPPFVFFGQQTTSPTCSSSFITNATDDSSTTSPSKKCTACPNPSAIPLVSPISLTEELWYLHGCMSVTRNESTRTACSWIDIPAGSSCLPIPAKGSIATPRIMTCGSDASFISQYLNPNSTVGTANGTTGGLEQKSSGSAIGPSASSSGRGGANRILMIGAASAGLLVLILISVFLYRRCFASNSKSSDSPLLPRHQPAARLNARTAKAPSNRNASSSCSVRSSLVHVPAAPSDPLHLRLDSTLSQLAVLHTARSPAAKFSPLGLLFVPFPDIDALPNPDLYLTTSLDSLVHDWEAIFHRLESECAQVTVTNQRGFNQYQESKHVNFAHYHMQRAQLMATTTGHIWRVLVLGSPAPNALIESLVEDMREVLVKAAAVFPTMELMGTEAGSEFRVDAMRGYGVSGEMRESRDPRTTMATEVSRGGMEEARVVKEMVWPGWMDVGKARVAIKARVIV